MIRSNDKTYEQRKRCMSLTISSVSFFTKHFMSVKSINNSVHCKLTKTDGFLRAVGRIMSIKDSATYVNVI